MFWKDAPIHMKLWTQLFIPQIRRILLTLMKELPSPSRDHKMEAKPQQTDTVTEMAMAVVQL